MDVRARITLFLDVLAAVSHAHNRLIIHRDLKPANIFVTQNGALKLLDFGIAKLIRTEDETHEDLTRVGSSPRTLSYASPEQITDSGVGTESDVYSLGVLLYELLTGVLPYSPKRDTLGALEEEILSGEPLLPSRVDFTAAQALERDTTTRKLGRLLQGDLDTILLTALKKSQPERYSTPAAFAEDLKRYLRNEPILARSESSWYRLRKFVSRNKVAVAVTALVTLAIVGSVAFAFVQMLEARVQREQARFEARRASATSGFMSLMLSEVGPGGKALPMRELLDKGLAMLEKQYGEDPRFIIQMLIGLSGRYMDIGEPEKELEALVRAEGLAYKLRDPELIAKVQCNTIDTELSLGRPDRAHARMATAERELAKLTHPVPTELQTDCLSERAYLAKQDGDYDRAIDSVKKELGVYEQAGLTKGTDYANALSFLSSLYGESGNAKAAYMWNLRAEQALIALGRSGTLNRIITLQNRAMELLRAGQAREAEDVEEDVLRRLTSDGAAEAPPQHRINHARILTRLGRNT